MKRAPPAVLVVVLMASVVLPAPFAALWPDTVRDLSESLRLARGDGVPLVGAPINFGPHLGPAFIWLQAIPLALFGTFTATSVFVALVASAKFALLFEIGRRLRDARLGLAIAAAAAVPSIAVYHWHVFFHPDWVEAAIAGAALLAVLALQRASLPLLYGAAAMLGLAMQFHLTAAFYFPVLLLALYRLAPGHRFVAHALAFAAIAAAWFAPLLFADLPHSRQVVEASGKIAQDLHAFSPRHVATVLATAYLDVPRAIGETYVAWLPAPAWLALYGTWALAVLAGAVVAVARGTRGERAALLALAALLLAGWTAAAAVRTFTSFYLCYFLLPLSAVVCGHCVYRLSIAEAPPWRWLAYTALGAAFAMALASAMGARTVLASGDFDSRLASIADLRNPSDGKVKARILGAAARDDLARRLCQGADPVAYGDLAYVLGASTGLDARLHCPRAPWPALTGPAHGNDAWTALTAREARELRREPAAVAGGLALFRVRAGHHPAAARAIEPGWYHFERLRDRGAREQVRVEARTDGAAAMMIYRHKPFGSHWRLTRVERNGTPAAAALETYNSLVFSGSGQAQDAWVIELETDAPRWIDVHSF